MIVLWGRKSAFNVQKVLWLLGELGLLFRHREVGGRFGGLESHDFLRLNPHGRVPVLEDGSTVVWESHAILRYLAASYGNDGIWAPDAAARSQVDQWMDWSQTSLQPAFMRLFWEYYRTPAARRDPALIHVAREECDRHFEALDAALGGRAFLSGDAFSLADVPAGAVLYRYFEMGLPVRRYPFVDRWYDRLCARPAYRSAVMVPFEELRGRLEF